VDFGVNAFLTDLKDVSFVQDMNPVPVEVREFLNLRQKPLVLTTEQAAVYLGVSIHYMALAARHKIVVPLAARSIRANATKFYARSDLDALTRHDLEKLVKLIAEYNKSKNRPAKDEAAEPEEEEIAIHRTLDLTKEKIYA
jgi:hypothetical protein